MKTHITLLKQYNIWRRVGGDDQPSPTSIGIALDEVIASAERYEAIRKLNWRQVSELFKRNLAGENLDEMVDEVAKSKNKDRENGTSKR